MHEKKWVEVSKKDLIFALYHGNFFKYNFPKYLFNE